MKNKTKKIFSIIGGVLFVMLYCFFVNGIHLDSDFEIILEHTPVPVEINTDNSDSGDKININTADAKQLEQLNGIGEKMAQRIIEYRTANGEFKQIEDIMKIQGIGKQTFETLKDDICIK